MDDYRYLRLSYEIDNLLDKIIRNSNLSDYEKKLRISAHIIIPLQDRIKELEEKLGQTK